MKATSARSPEELGQLIRVLRHERAWTQAQLAEWLSVSRPTIVKLEAGGNVSVSLALRALSVLGATATVHPKTASVAEISAGDNP